MVVRVWVRVATVRGAVGVVEGTWRGKVVLASVGRAWGEEVELCRGCVPCAIDGTHTRTHTEGRRVRISPPRRAAGGLSCSTIYRRVRLRRGK